jgi:hypothetical protein
MSVNQDIFRLIRTDIPTTMRVKYTVLSTGLPSIIVSYTASGEADPNHIGMGLDPTISNQIRGIHNAVENGRSFESRLTR